MMHRNSIAVAGETAASYALIKLIPAGLGDGAGQRMRINLALALDASGSMYDDDQTGVSRLQRVQDAAIAAMNELKPDDTLSLVAFAHNALVLLPPTPIANRAEIERAIREIENSDIDQGGTCMNDGMRLALEQVEQSSGPGTLANVLVLTDGETSGEQECRQLAQRAAENKVNVSLIGVGLDWKASLIKDLAGLSNGKWHYIDTQQKDAALRIFQEEFQSMAAAAFTDVEMHVRPMKDIRIKRIRQVVPEIKELKPDEPEERHLVAQLGTLEKDKSPRYVLDMSLPKRPDGKYVIAQLEITYSVGTGTRESTGPIPLEMTYTAAGMGYVNAEVARHIDEVQIFELNNNLQAAIATENKAEIQKVAEQIEKKGELMGKRAAKKTMLAKQVLQELNAGGRVSKKTQLAMEDSARMAEEMPTN
jgi:Ca-activated chloride channel family protein